MERRKAIQQLGMGLGAIVALPSWAQSWKKDDFPEIVFENEVLLSSLVECIIPESDTPGAMSIGTHLFIERMVNDCYGTDVKRMFAAGLEKLNKRSIQKFSKGFSDLELAQRTALFGSFEKSSETTDKRFFSFIKNLTVRSYTMSEYYLKNYRAYEMAPGYFHGCVPV